MNNSDYRHVVLYAKNWYKKTDTVNDLKIIIGERNGIDPDAMKLADV